MFSKFLKKSSDERRGTANTAQRKELAANSGDKYQMMANQSGIVQRAADYQNMANNSTVVQRATDYQSMANGNGDIGLSGIMPHVESEEEIKKGAQENWEAFENFKEIYGCYPWEVEHSLNPRDLEDKNRRRDLDDMDMPTLVRSFSILSEKHDFKGKHADKINMAVNDMKIRGQKEIVEKKNTEPAELAGTAEHTTRMFQYIKEHSKALSSQIRRDFIRLKTREEKEAYLMDMSNEISRKIGRGLWAGNTDRDPILNRYEENQIDANGNKLKVKRPEKVFKQGHSTLSKLAADDTVDMVEVLSNLAYNLDAKSYGRRAESAAKIKKDKDNKHLEDAKKAEYAKKAETRTLGRFDLYPYSDSVIYFTLEKEQPKNLKVGDIILEHENGYQEWLVKSVSVEENTCVIEKVTK